ncbi:DUF1820 family protein [Biformimicrobium ophioploci]|uniref:DUF1820 family protein n=2 Tax=Biformimicrobium ophioploci TaxID=3036711 RepID=A0ABQ6LWS2_9GAMM|nr:DUF1820 family protein [Microbulbifer sp. NKW57]
MLARFFKTSGPETGNSQMANPIYKVIFYNQNQVFEVYARAIYQSEMYGFIEVEEFVFGERAQLVVDPAEEKLKNEFAAVKRSYIPMHSIVRIDEVEKEGVGKVVDVKGDKVAHFPFGGQGRRPGESDS